MLEIVVLISGGGSNLLALLEASETQNTGFRVVAVGSDTDAEGLTHATSRGIPTFIVPPHSYDNRDVWGTALLTKIQEYAPALVVSAGFMRILPSHVVDALSPHLINTHPSLLPLFPGAHAVKDALTANVHETGVTVHLIDSGVDTGPQLRQARVPILPGDTETLLHERIKQCERPLLVQTVQDIATGTLSLSTHSPHKNHP